jgi:formylglycine-generating enzyme required for sulfatase activity
MIRAPAMDRLRRALDVWLKRCAEAAPEPDDVFLARHADLRDLLELMLAERAAGPAAKAADGGRQQLGDFRILREIGRGGMGVVYSALQLSLEREVALKVLPAHLTLQPTAVARFKREALTAARLEHPGIVKVFAVGSEGDTHYFAMERIDGQSLDRLSESLRGDAPIDLLTVRRLVAVLADVADALEHAHRAGVVHRDVKPSNVMLRLDGTPVLTDFGLAREETLPSMTASGSLAGTPYYVSPEQASGKPGLIDHRSDVFSLGVTLYEVLTHRRPFDAPTSQEVLHRILTRAPVDPRRLNPALPSDLAAIVLKALEKDREHRYQSAAEFADDLRAFLANRPVRARHLSRSARLRRWVQREPRLAAVAAGVVLLLGFAVGGTLLLLGRREAETRRLALIEALQLGRRLEAEVAAKEAALEQLRRLSDLQRLEDLRQQSDELWPPVPGLLARYDEWLAAAGALRERLPRHETTLAALAARAGAEPERRWQRAKQQQLVDELRDLPALIDGVASRRAFAATVAERTVDGPAASAAWAAARAEIRALPAYRGLDLPPQLGLLPIGRDRESGLWEFAHLQSGAPPARGDDGALELGDDTGIVLVLLPGGRCRIGSGAPGTGHERGQPHVDPWDDGYSPLHEVDVPPFFLAKFETTQGQWLRAAARNPSHRTPQNSGVTLRHPVEGMTWPDAERLARWLGLQLPVEQQWEYACRAGTTTVFSTGDTLESLQRHANLHGRERAQGTIEDQQMTMALDDGFPMTAPVGSLRPNAFGLHDMHGNVMEWCRDAVPEDPGRTGGAVALADPPEHAQRIIRGGGYVGPVLFARSAARFWAKPDVRYAYLGVRFARAVERS